MTSSSVSKLRPWVQRTINALNLPFRAIEYISTPIINILRSLWSLLRRICKQNWVFLCIFYLHLWQTFKTLTPIRPLAQHWTRITSGLIFVSCATLSALILHASIPIFVASWRDSKGENHAVRANRIALFVFTCAPACAVIGAAVTALYFKHKQHRHGVYMANMRKLGRGYWADPRDLEDWRKARTRTEAIE